MIRRRHLLLALMAFALSGVASNAFAARKFCAVIDHEYWDSKQGEDYLAYNTASYGTGPARRHWAVVERSGTSVWSAYLDASGCTPVLTSSMTAGNYKFWLQSTVSVGSTYVMAVDGSPPAGVWVYWDLGALPASTGTGSLTVHSLSSGATLQDVPAFNVSQVFTVPAFESADQPFVGTDPGFVYADQQSPNCPSGLSCCEGSSVYLTQYPGYPPDWQVKTVIGHEFGHCVQNRLFGITALGSNFNDSIKLCNCSHVTNDTFLHCFQKKISHQDARDEGWAHFFAATLFNDPSGANAWFGYFGQLRFPYVTGIACHNEPSSLTCKNPPIPWDVITPALWMETHCGSNVTDRSIEADWLGFWYQAHNKTSNKYSFQNIKSVFLAACPGSGLCDGGDDVRWDELVDAADMTFPGAKGQYWENRGVAYGVAH